MSRAAEHDIRGIGQIVTRARRDLELLIGRRVDSVSAVQRREDGEDGEGGWVVFFEVVELERVPDSTSVIGSYQTSVDSDGGLLGYERVRRYHRNQVSEAEY